MLINVTQAIGELAIVYPVSGGVCASFRPWRKQSCTHARSRNTGFYTLVCRFLDPSFGMGALYAIATSLARTALTHFSTHSPRMECAPLSGFPPSLHQSQY